MPASSPNGKCFRKGQELDCAREAGAAHPDRKHRVTCSVGAYALPPAHAFTLGDAENPLALGLRTPERKDDAVTEAESLFASAYAAGLAVPLGWGVLADYLEEAGPEESARRARALYRHLEGERTPTAAVNWAHPTAHLAAMLTQEWVADRYGRSPWDAPAVREARRLGLWMALALPADNEECEAARAAARAAAGADAETAAHGDAAESAVCSLNKFDDSTDILSRSRVTAGFIIEAAAWSAADVAVFASPIRNAAAATGNWAEESARVATRNAADLILGKLTALYNGS